METSPGNVGKREQLFPFEAHIKCVRGAKR
jgi:hypothetical protein